VEPFDLGTVDRLLTTTRSVRRRLDLTREVEPALLRECLELALQAPTGSNSRSWRFVVVTDADRRAALADIYRKGLAIYAQALEELAATGFGVPLSTEEGRLRALDEQTRRSMRSAAYLTQHLHEVPVHVVPCLLGRLPSHADAFRAAAYYGSIHPAIWSFQLALRSRGLGSVYTTLHLVHEAEAAEVLGIPHDRVTQIGLVPVAHTTGDDFGRAWREPVEEVAFADGWDRPWTS
jgi:nitroreductase